MTPICQRFRKTESSNEELKIDRCHNITLTIPMKLNRKGGNFVKLSMVAALSLSFGGVAMADENDTPMTKEMKAASLALKNLRKIARDDWAGMAKAARDAHTALLKSMPEQATMIKDMKDGKEKAIALADSRRILGLCYAALCELEIAFINKDQAKVDAAMEKIKALKKEGHENYSDD